MIYLDNASTTRCSEISAEIIKNSLTNEFFNPSAKYGEALKRNKMLDECRQEIVKLVGGNDNYSVVFTGSATEANNLVLNSSLNKHKPNLIGAGEHASIYETAKHLKMLGYDIAEIPLNGRGEPDIAKFKELMKSTTAFVSVMLVSNETGAITNIKEISRIARTTNPKVLIHVDGVQGFGKIKINMQEWGIDYLTLSAHKVEGPKGVGCLVFKKQAKLEPHIFGGGQENGKRSGTENLPCILGFVNSAKELVNNLAGNFNNVKNFKHTLVNYLTEKSRNAGLDFVVNGDTETASPYILSCGFLGTKGEVLLHSLEAKGILVGTGSACNSKHSGNRILSEMGKTTAQIECNIRLSFAPETLNHNPEDIATIIVECAKMHNNTTKR